MAQSDWASLTDQLATSVLARGVSSGFTPPNNGGSYVYGFNSLSTGVVGAAGLVLDQVNFNPTPANTLGEIAGAIKRLPSGGNIGFAPMLFLGLQGGSVNDSGYILGLQDEEPASIVFRKGALVAGIPTGDVGSDGILRKSIDPVTNNTYVHIRMLATVGGTGDVTFEFYQNDLDTNPVDAPVWEAIPGMSDFVDDAIGVNSGSLPYTSGRFGFAMYIEDISRRAVFDQITIARQLP